MTSRLVLRNLIPLPWQANRYPNFTSYLALSICLFILADPSPKGAGIYCYNIIAGTLRTKLLVPVLVIVFSTYLDNLESAFKYNH